MDFDLSYEQRALQDLGKRIAEKSIRPIQEAHDPNKSLPKEAMLKIFQIFASEGLTAPRLPVEVGGGGMKMLDYGLIFEQLPPVIANSLISHEVTTTRIRAESDPAAWEHVLPQVIAGKKICCTGTTEPDTGSDPRSIRTRVEEQGDELVINGRKMWITNGTISDYCVVTTVAGVGADGRNIMRRILVEREKSPYESREIEVFGFKQGHTAELLFDNCRVPKTNSLGAQGDVARLLTTTWNGNRPLLGLIAVHLAQKALDMSVEYAGVRKQFGRLIGSTQLVQQHLADMATAIETSRLLCYKALWSVDQGHRVNGLAAMAKRHATTACLAAINTAMGLHGAMGISEEMGLEFLYREARMLPIPDGTNEILALIIGREITHLDAFRK